MKYRILAALRECKPEYLSGEALSGRLRVTRTTVWKCINELRLEGYEIDSVSRRGYRLVSEPDAMNSYALSENLGNRIIGRKILCFDEVDSTNIRAKEAADDLEDGTVIIAERQTSGRGRLGKKWDSVEGAGIYMSVILKPDIPPEEVQMITLAAAAAVAGALGEAAGIDAGIKWPNDIVIEGKKVCGILTEMSTEMERVNFIVLGIGINYTQMPEDFPEELREKAVSVMDYLNRVRPSAAVCRKSDLARAVLKKLDELYLMLLDGNKQEVVEIWKGMSATIGKEIAVTGRDVSYTGRAVDINSDGRLVIYCDDGTRRELLSGEVSVRGLLGYI